MTPQLPRIKLAEVDKLASIFTGLLPREARELTVADVQGVVRSLSSHPKQALANLPERTVTATLLQYAGKAMTPRLVNTIARQMAGRFDALFVMPLQAFQVIVTGWTAFEIVAAAPTPWRETDDGHRYTLYALTGGMAGTTFDKKFPDSWIRGLAYRLGYSRRSVYSDNGSDLTGFRFWANVVVSDRDPRVPDLVDIVPDAQTLKHNKAIVKRRTRLDKDLDDDLCPFAYDHPCNECSASATECPAAYNRTIHGARAVRGEPAAAPG